MENVLNSNSGMSNECDTIGINSCQNKCVVTAKVCVNLWLFLHKKTLKHAYRFCFSIVFAGQNPGR